MVRGAQWVGVGAVHPRGGRSGQGVGLVSDQGGAARRRHGRSESGGMTESLMVTWTLESNAADQWALFLRVGGIAYQQTAWFQTRDALLLSLTKAVYAV